jgi:hypothetical protein
MNILVYHLLSGQYIISEVDPISGILYNPMELHAIPPSESKQSSVALTPFGTFYGMVSRNPVVPLEPSKYYCASPSLALEDPLSVAYIQAVEKLLSN